MRILKISVPLLSLAVLSGCVGFGAGYDIENLRDAEGTGSAFTQALTKEYQEFDAFEADKMMDWPDAEYFAEKGLRAAGGEAVEPELLENWECRTASSTRTSRPVTSRRSGSNGTANNSP